MYNELLISINGINSKIKFLERNMDIGHCSFCSANIKDVVNILTWQSYERWFCSKCLSIARHDISDLFEYNKNKTAFCSNCNDQCFSGNYVLIDNYKNKLCFCYKCVRHVTFLIQESSSIYLNREKQLKVKEVEAEEKSLVSDRNLETNLIKEKNMFEKITDSVVSSVKEGAVIGSSKAAADAVVKMARNAFGSNYPQFFETPIGKRLEPYVMCTLIITLSDCFENKYPTLQKIKYVAEKAMTGFVVEDFGDVLSALEPLVANLSKDNMIIDMAK